MYLDNIHALDALALAELEAVLDAHTLKPVPVNEYTAFSWSAARHRLFARCKRQYYLNYYAPRRVRQRGNHPAIGALWWLKQATSLRAWMGAVVHEVAREAVLAHWRGAALSMEEGIERALTTYNRGVRASRRGTRFEGRWVVLQEHIYPGDYQRADWENAEQSLAETVETLFMSDAYRAILNLPPDAILEVDEPFQYMLFDETRVFAIPDVLLHNGNLWCIIDWKTGSVEGEEIRTQAGIYALYAHLCYGASETDVAVWIADLGGGGASLEPPGGLPSLDETAALIRRSMAAMRDLIENDKYHTAAIASFPMTDDLTLCRDCNFKRACWRHELEWDD